MALTAFETNAPCGMMLLINLCIYSFGSVPYLFGAEDSETSIFFYVQNLMSLCMMLWCLSHGRVTMVQASLHKCTYCLLVPYGHLLGKG